VKIALVSSTVPFVQGGGRFIVDWLASKLREAGNQVEIVWLPSVDDPSSLLSQMAAFRMIDLERTCDRVITFRPPAHVINHRNKIVWFIHHIRVFYDLWDTPYRPVPDTPYWRAFRRALMIADTNALREARRVYTNSKVVADRLRHFNDVEGEILYPPVFEPERFHCDTWGGEIVCICRLERHKRQHLLVEAMRFVKTPVRLHLAGDSLDEVFIGDLKAMIARFDLGERVTFDRRWISEAEKAALLASALAAAYFPLDEDSYGYPTLEAAHAQKATIGALDGGGVSEFVKDGENGYLLPPEPQAIAAAFDRLWSDRQLARRLGGAARARIDEMSIRWDHVIERLLS
jgi:glycosyltransferase involved in cell wall biosynthesis